MQERREVDKKEVSDVCKYIKDVSEGLDGITISGGEPFDQVEPLYLLLDYVRKKTNLDIMVYSGYTIDEIKGLGAKAGRILQIIDVLVDGPYREETDNKKLWRGSDNQTMHILSERSAPYRCFVDADYGKKRPLSFELDGCNRLKIIGIPERGFLRAFEQALMERDMTTQKEDTRER